MIDPEIDDLEAGLAFAFGAEALPSLGKWPTAIEPPPDENTTGPKTLALPESEVPSLASWPRQTDRYEIQGALAQGGFGIILRARDKKLGREVALKVLRPELEGRKDLEQRLVQEAQISSQLQHPGIVPVHDFGLLGPQRPYIAMKLVRGEALDTLLAARSAGAELPRFIGIFAKVCETVAYAHSRDVIHRDLKPGNIMVGQFGAVQVMDWGLAKVLDRGALGPKRESLTESHPVSTVLTQSTSPTSVAGAVMGTPAYMPPEQARGEISSLDERADVFGLGAILFEILTGSKLHEGSTVDEVKVKARSEDLSHAFERLEQCEADRDLTGLARSCLAPRRKKRPANAGEVARSLERHLETQDARARAAELAAAEARATVLQERRLRRLTLTLGAVLLVATMAGGAWWIWHAQSRRQQERTAEQAYAPALARARRLSDAARAELTLDPLRWTQALAAVREAESAVQAGQVEGNVRRTVLVLREEIEAAAEAAGRDRDLLEVLRDLRDSDLPTKKRLEEYERVFLEHGINLEASDVALKIRGSAVCSTLVGVLDDWIACLGSLGMVDQAQGLTALANAADRDDERARLRAAALAGDRAGLVATARGADFLKSPPGTLEVTGIMLGRRGEHGEATLLLRKAFELHPDHFGLASTCGYWAAKMSPPDLILAARCESVCIALNPKSAPHWNNLASALSGLGQTERALASIDRALELQPRRIEFLYNRACFLNAAKRWEDALAAYRLALEVSSTFLPALEMEAALLSRLKGANEALPHVERLAAERTQSIEASFILGNAYRRLGRKDDAVKAYERVLVLDEGHVRARSNVGRLLFDLGRSDEALHHLRKVVTLPLQDAFPWRNLTDVLWRRDEVRAVIDTARQGLRSFPKDAVLNRFLADALLQTWDIGPAEAAARTAVQIDPSDGENWVTLSAVLLDVGDYRGSLHAAEQVASARNLLRESAARLRDVQNRCRTALDLERELPTWLKGETSPTFDQARVLAQVCTAREQVDDAVRFWGRALEDPQLTSGHHRSLAAACALRGAAHEPKALAWLEAALGDAERMARRTERGARHVRELLSVWLQHPAFARAREAATTTTAENSAAWRDLWSRVRALHRELQDAP